MEVQKPDNSFDTEVFPMSVMSEAEFYLFGCGETNHCIDTPLLEDRESKLCMTIAKGFNEQCNPSTPETIIIVNDTSAFSMNTSSGSGSGNCNGDHNDNSVSIVQRLERSIRRSCPIDLDTCEEWDGDNTGGNVNVEVGQEVEDDQQKKQEEEEEEVIGDILTPKETKKEQREKDTEGEGEGEEEKS